MSTAMNNTMSTSSEGCESTEKAAENAGAISLSTLFKAAKMALGVSSALRALGIDVFGWTRLLGKRGPLGATVLFGAGLAVGTGAGVLFAPASGESTRRALLRRLDGMKRDALGGIEKVGDEVKEIEHRIEESVSDAADAVKGKVNAMTDNVKETVAGARSSTSPQDTGYAEASRGPTPTRRPASMQNGTRRGHPFN